LTRLERYQREGTAGGLEIELLDAADVRRRFPYLGPDVCGATWSKRDGTANPRLATPAVARAAGALGAEIFPNTRVVTLEAAAEGFRATTDRDLVFEAPLVVNAAGAWGNEIAAMFDETTPMFPAAPPNFVTEPLPYFITSALQDAAGAVIIRQVARGNVSVGFYPRGPADRVRNRAPVPPAKVLLGLGHMARVVPMLGSAQVIRVWSGIEGYLPDMLPVMGWSRTTKNLLHAFGFCGHGFQLSPGVGYTLAEMIDEGRAQIPIDAFAIDRFTGEVQPDQERLSGEFDAALASAAIGSAPTQAAQP
jgi:sarcosine oxidase subunit beta